VKHELGISNAAPDQNDVTYQYGSPALLVGRIARVTDESGSELRAYDKLGQLIH
jgi:hypothetical protein